MGSRRTWIAEETPAMSPRSLSKDQHIHLGLVFIPLTRSPEAELCTGLIITQDLTELLRRQIHVIEDTHRIDLST